MGFMLKYWNHGLLDNAGSNPFGPEGPAETAWDFDGTPQELVEDLKRMGPTYVKLGQLLSTRSDLLPQPYLSALVELQDNVSPVPFDEIERIVEAGLGLPLGSVFMEFDRQPLASASIGQVHKAVLPSGETVAVKVQRPGIRERFAEDIETLEKMISLAIKHTEVAKKYSFGDILDELRTVLARELDYGLEAANLLELWQNLSGYGELLVPLPYLEQSSTTVLCMQFINGKKITEVPLGSMEHNPRDLAHILVRAYLQQVLRDGFVHVDPHPGNVLYTADHRIALIDLGMVARFSPNIQEYLIQLLLALTNRDAEATASVLLALGEPGEDLDVPVFTKKVRGIVTNQRQGSSQGMELGHLLVRLNRIAAEHYVALPMEINILGKVLLNLEPIIKGLHPDFNLEDAVEGNLLKIIRDRFREDFQARKILPPLIDGKRLAQNLPKRLDDITKHFADNNFKIRIEAINEKRVTDGFQKVANRIALGLIISSMILGAALLMQVPSDFMILGYPGLAMLFFLLAVVGGIALSLTIVFKDEKNPTP